MMIGRSISMSWISGWRREQVGQQQPVAQQLVDLDRHGDPAEPRQRGLGAEGLEQHAERLEERRVAEVVEPDRGGGLGHERVGGQLDGLAHGGRHLDHRRGVGVEDRVGQVVDVDGLGAHAGSSGMNRSRRGSSV